MINAKAFAPILDLTPEVSGFENWSELFREMKTNCGKEFTVRVSRLHSEDSHANKFFMAEQIFSQATKEKESSNSIDLQRLRVQEALPLTYARFEGVYDELESGDLGHNVGNNKDHLFKVICGQGTIADPESQKLKFAMSQWLLENNLEYSASMQHGTFFVNISQLKLMEVDVL